jgi:hypothetical protein
VKEDDISIFQPESLIVKSSLWVHAIAGKLNKVQRRDDETGILKYLTMAIRTLQRI